MFLDDLITKYQTLFGSLKIIHAFLYSAKKRRRRKWGEQFT